MAREVETEPGWEDAKQVFDQLRDDATQKVERYQLHFLEDFTKLVQEAGLPLETEYPRLQLLRGIELEVVFAEKRTLLNGRPLKTVDPTRLIWAVVALQRHLYDRPLDPQGFIDGIYGVYQKVNHAAGRADGDTAPIQTIYMEYTLSLQSRSFFQDMAKGKFHGYDADQFAVDFWRYFNSGVATMPDGRIARLSPGRNNALWLIDSSGERRRISGLSFQRG